MANIVQIILQGTDKTGKMFKGVEKSSKGLLDNLKAVGLTAASIAGVGIALKKAFDIGKEGAIVAQTSESFDLLLEKVGAAPDLLDQLTDASRGTMSQMDLMSSTATLLAGAQGELAERLAASTPRLMEIAKAANKLNPALGDTAFMYQSIATGVKRAQPLILDNLGLTIKVGAANEKYAKSLGKTVEQLTAEEKAMALLEETMRAGDAMIAQVGGSTDSAADDFLRLEAKSEDLSNALKELASVAMADTIEATADMATENVRIIDTMREFNLHLNLFKGFMDESGESVARNYDELFEWARAQEEAAKQAKITAEANRDAIPDWFALNKEIREGVTAAEEAAAANRDIVLSLSEITQAELAREVLKELNEAWEEGQISTEDYKSLFVETATTIGGLDSDTVKAQVGLFDLRQEIDEGTLSLDQIIDRVRTFGRELGLIEIPEMIFPTIPWDVPTGDGGGGGGGGGGSGGGATHPGPPEYATSTTTHIHHYNISDSLDLEEMAARISEF